MDKYKLIKYEDKIRLEREINILKKLRNRNIVYLYSIIKTERQILLIIEYIKGQELFQYILLKRNYQKKKPVFILVK